MYPDSPLNGESRDDIFVISTLLLVTVEIRRRLWSRCPCEDLWSIILASVDITACVAH